MHTHMYVCTSIDVCILHNNAGADPREGLWGLEIPLQIMSYSIVSASNNYCSTGAKLLWIELTRQ